MSLQHFQIAEEPEVPVAEPISEEVSPSVTFTDITEEYK